MTRSTSRATDRDRWLKSGAPSAKHREAQVEALREVIESGILQDPTGGPKATELETAFADYIGVAHAVGVNSGTAALSCALVALGVGPGHEVIVPALTFVASATAATLAGATPVFCDVDERTLCIDVDDARRRITPRTKAVMPVHLLGYPSDMERVVALAREHGLAVIEDCCQGHGAIVGDAKVGSIGDVGCFSFSKRHLISVGGGGIVTTDDPELADRLRRVSFHGIADMDQLWTNFRDYDVRGFNFGMSELFAALALLDVPRLDAYLERRREIARIYDHVLAGLDDLDPLADPEHGVPCHHNYALRLRQGARTKRDWLADELRKEGVTLLVNLVPLTRTTAFAPTAGDSGPCPVSESLGDRLIVLELDHNWSSAEGEEQASRVRSAVERSTQTV
ncbi:MAG: perosamine synthetase [Solirubrobacteraceae bacterium]|jgi:perosamine synthetase|nr:perosamine synthetase [Solirubrobacteraceae bacterium]